jgi:hypothetical protein
MSTVEEIEKAVVQLPSEARARLLFFLAQSLRAEGAPMPEPRTFSQEQINEWLDADEEAMRRFKAGR